MAERTTIEGYDIEQDFTGFRYTKLKAMYQHPRIKSLKADGVVRVAGMNYWKGPAWYILVGQALSPDDDLYATFVNDSQGEAKVLVVREGVGLTIDGIEVLRKLLPHRSLDLFDVARKVGEMHILRLGSGNGPLYPHAEAVKASFQDNGPLHAGDVFSDDDVRKSIRTLEENDTFPKSRGNGG